MSVMPLKITVDSLHVETKSGTSAKSGKPYTIRSQTGWACLVDASGVPERFPSKIKLNLDDDSPAYPCGDYFHNPASFYVGDFGKLEQRPVLIACVDAAKK